MTIGFTSLLGIVFIVLKLTGFIQWSWIWVLAPVWIGTVLWIIFVGIGLLLVAVNSRR